MKNEFDLSTATGKTQGVLLDLKDNSAGTTDDEDMLSLASEHFLKIFVNETPVFQVVCSPFHLEELAVGRLISEGIIQSFDDIETVYRCETGARVKVFLKEKRDFTRVTDGLDVPSCCTDNKTFYQSKTEGLAPLTPIEWNKNDIKMLQNTLKNGLPLHCATHAVHAAILARDSQILFFSEDLGRHNALDKVIGYACMNGIDLSSCILFTSGRVPTDMVSKTIRARIPVLIGKGAPTVESVRLARDFNLELVRCLPGRQVMIY